MTKKANNAQFTEAQVALLAKSVKDVNAAQKAIEKAQGKRQGAYAVSTVLAAEMGEGFDEAMGTLFGQIRSGELAKTFSAKPAKKEGEFTVPSSLSSARSVLAAAVRYGIDLFDRETGEVRPFGQIRQDKVAFEAALALAERDDRTIARDSAVAALRALADRMAETEADQALADLAGQIEAQASELLAEWLETGGEVAEADAGDDADVPADDVAEAA